MGEARFEDVARVADRWADEVSRLGGRNTLLRFQDLKAGTIDLAAADPEGRKRLLDGEQVTVGRLFPHEPLRTSALRSARALHLKIRELVEEHGIWTGYVAVGIATWAEPYVARRPAVPVLLRRLRIDPTSAAQADFVVTVDDDPDVNPVLLLAMATRVGIRLEPDDLRDPRGQLRYPFVVDRLREYAPAHVVDGFAIAHRAVLATFTDSILETAAALRAEAGQLGEHDLPALLAGVDLALPPAAASSTHQPLALDADDDQAAVVDAVVAGGSHVVLAGPGTGLTQTLANAVTALVARGRRVLVVAAPREPLADLADALHEVGLQDAVLHLHAGVTQREALEQIRSTVATVGRAAVPEARDPRGPDDAGALLQAYARWSRTEVSPWGISPYDAQARLLEAASEPGGDLRGLGDLRLAPDAVARLHGARLSRVRDALGSLADVGGLSPADERSPWLGAHLDDTEAAGAAVESARRLLRDGIPSARDAATRAALEVGLPAPLSMADALALVDLLDQVRDTMSAFLPEIWTAPLDQLVAATADRATRSRPGWLSRRRLRRTARDLRLEPSRGPSGADLHEALVAARERVTRWRALARDERPPRLAEHSALAIATVGEAGTDLARLEAALPSAGLPAAPFVELGRQLTALVADHAGAQRLPTLRGLRSLLASAGVDPLVESLTGARADRTQALAAFDRLWLAGVLDAVNGSDPLREAGDPDDVVARFGAADRRMLAGFAFEARRRYARTLKEAVAAAAAPADALAAARSLRGAMTGAADLALAAKPVWLVPALRVASLIPASVTFDLAVVEAGHLVDAAVTVPALARARRVVVAGDPVGVPPMEFAVAAEPEQEPEADPPGYVPKDAPTGLLEALRPHLPSHPLTRHYRSADERLVRFAATSLPGSHLAAWPGADGDRRVTLELVTQPPLLDRQEDSVAAEVAHVVTLVLEHAKTRPEDSLMVVTLGVRHAERVREALRAAVGDTPELEPFFAVDRREPFVVTSLDHVRAEVRDVVIVSVGYGRTTEGRLLYRFGSLASDGGDRRLVTATTRSREHLVVVSTVRGEDLNPRRLLANGPRLLRELLLFADRAEVAQTAPGRPSTLVGLESEIARQLRRAGLPIVTSIGHGPLRLPIALRDRSGTGPALAVVTDTMARAGDTSARERERLVPQHLERLGWHVVRVWSARWAADLAQEVARVDAAWEAVRAAVPARRGGGSSPTQGGGSDPVAADAAESGAAETDAPAESDAPAVPGAAAETDAPAKPDAPAVSGAVAETDAGIAPGPTSEDDSAA